MAGTNVPRRRVGRTLRRTRAPGNGNAPLQAIAENTVVDLRAKLSQTSSVNSTSSHFDRSPPPEKKKKQNETKEVVKDKKHKRDEVDELPSLSSAEHFDEVERKRRKTLQLLDELEDQLEQRCADLIAEAEQKAADLRSELNMQLMFLPNAVRKMPWKTFIEDFGGSLEKVIQNAKDQGYRRFQHQAMASPAHNKKTANIAALGLTTPAGVITRRLSARLSSFQTPAYGKEITTPMVPKTVLRTARKGEMTYSVRGSPILPETAVKAPAGAVVATFSEDSADPLACITLDNNTALDLSNPEQMNAESRAEAKAKLHLLQARVAALLKQFN